jgi:hypothetical protein
MKKALQSVFDFLLFSNIFMSLCAVAQALVTFHLIGSKPVYAGAGFACLHLLWAFTTSVSLLPGLKSPQTSPYKRVRWFFSTIGSWLLLPSFRYYRWYPYFF